MSDWRDVPCKLWEKATTAKGYGEINRLVDGKGKTLLVHRIAWEEIHGPIPAGLFVCHHCDVRNCFEVLHLFLGTNQENMQDAAKKGRLSAIHSKLTDDDVRAIRRLGDAGMTHRAIGLQYGVGRSTVSAILCGLRWKYVK